jgi:hypothetical protein
VKVGELLGVSVEVGVNVRVAVGTVVFVEVGVTVGVELGVALGNEVRVGDSVWEGIELGVKVELTVKVGVEVGGTVFVGREVAITDVRVNEGGILVGEAVTVAVKGIGEEVAACATAFCCLSAYRVMTNNAIPVMSKVTTAKTA